MLREVNMLGGWSPSMVFLTPEEMLIMTSVIIFGAIFILMLVWVFRTYAPFGWSQQRMYDHVKRGLLEQRAISKGTGESACRYRGEGGRKCAVGFLIPNQLYDKLMEYNHFGDSRIQSAIQVKIGRPLNQSDRDLLSDLMYVHDAVDVLQWPNALAAVAHRFGLRP